MGVPGNPCVTCTIKSKTLRKNENKETLNAWSTSAIYKKKFLQV